MRDEIQAIVEVLKKRFNNLGASELVSLAFQIHEAIETVRKKE
jgi:hypothetical protein